ncbi:MAG: cation transporter dimerization domain-containing protein, partial [Chromatiales bacterium]|nr:cation transporter dimerization domain-containing protein [Chromatiales bacterium]
IVKAVWDIARGAIMELLDHAPSADVVAQVENIIDHVPDVRFVHDVRVRSVAGMLYVSCTIEVDGRLSIDDGARIADEVENTLIENLEGIANVLIQVRPAGSFAARVLATGLENVTDEDLV